MPLWLKCNNSWRQAAPEYRFTSDIIHHRRQLSITAHINRSFPSILWASGDEIERSEAKTSPMTDYKEQESTHFILLRQYVQHGNKRWYRCLLEGGTWKEDLSSSHCRITAFTFCLAFHRKCLLLLFLARGGSLQWRGSRTVTDGHHEVQEVLHGLFAYWCQRPCLKDFRIKVFMAASSQI
ncbi:hypothetical protein EYF80_020645 [Liparis tanakae]|uniref:Uncharacterized protein n=1 Tax=Liparis tanakae TaxID=230148 RepID=A0A4Z2HTV4_9TELE|nr:hypothetical protein EYF80_020645 [Liparis tanakae]